MNEATKIFRFGKKFSEQHLDQFVHEFYKSYDTKGGKFERYEFDLSDLEWMSNQELLVFTGILKYLFESEIDFKVYFLKSGSSEGLEKRKANQFLQIWEVWKIYQIIPNDQYNKYFDIDGRFIDQLKDQFGLHSLKQEIYDRYGVTPFLILKKIENYDDQEISQVLNKIYTLSEATNEILRKNNCFLPFANQTLSSVLTKELYENFLDHFKPGIFKSKNDFAFLSISLKKRLNPQFSQQKIQHLLNENFESENLLDFKDFFTSNNNDDFKNEALLQISFLDFGVGIPQTLKRIYNRTNSITNSSKSTATELIDYEILKYSFEPSSSQHDLNYRYQKSVLTPRGLYDVLSVVKRFEGLVIVRSNYGKISFDFSAGKSMEEATRFFGEELLFFPGTLVSIYIPERSLEKTFDYSSIKPNIEFTKFDFKKKDKKIVRLFDIQSELKTLGPEKKDLYNHLYEILIRNLTGKSDCNNLFYFDFEGYDLDERITKKVIYFLCTDYSFNYVNNVIVLNPPPKHLLQSIKEEIFNLGELDRKFRFHPTPFIYFNEEKKQLEIFWLGVYSEEDLSKLNQLLFQDSDLRASDFEYPEDVIGHVNHYDEHGNLYTAIDSTDIYNFYEDKKQESRREEIEGLIKNSVRKKKDALFLCNGNYYQEEYLFLGDLFTNKYELDYISHHLFDKLKLDIPDVQDKIFVTITSSSHKILQSLIRQGLIHSENSIELGNYQTFETEHNFLHLTKKGLEVILLCDVISTGYMVEKFEKKIQKFQANLIKIGVVVDSVDNDSKVHTLQDSNFKTKLTSCFRYSIKKYRRSEISDRLKKGITEIIRINPYTNSPIETSENDTGVQESVLMRNEEFLELLDSSQIKIGYFTFNNLIHPYFFNMDSVLNKEFRNSNVLLEKLIDLLEQKAKIKDAEIVFYPKNSGVKNIDFNYFRNSIMLNHRVEFFELERFSTNEGWRFAYPPKSLVSKAQSKKVLILDDGSCSGESILQMIDEVAFLQVKEIVVLSIVGRLNDHKKNFFSRLENITSHGCTIKISVFFGCHWYLPTYHLSKSPVIEELDWLNKLSNFDNCPKGICQIALNVSKELELKEIGDKNNKYLVKNKTGNVISKTLISTRNEFGKVSEFKYYTEYFEYFDNFISKYEHQNRKERGSFPYEQIELVCAVIIHEPYLFHSIEKILPDVVSKIEEFIFAIFWNENRIMFQDLKYDWDIRNFIHLLFIVFKNEKFFDQIDTKRFIILIKDFSPKNIDYLLYKLSAYLPINTISKDEDFSGKVKVLINKLIEENKLNENLTRSLKRFRSFIYSLPSNNDFESKLSKVKHNYDKIIDDRYHKECITAQIDILLVQLETLLQAYNEETERLIISTWDKIAPFLYDILDLSVSYPSFFISFNVSLYNSLESGEASLRKKYGILNDLIYDINSNSDLGRIRTLADSIYQDYINSSSTLYKIFKNLITTDIKDEFDDFINLLIKRFNPLLELNGLKNITDSNKAIDLPLTLIKDTLFDHLISNFRHADLKHKIIFEWEEIKKGKVLILKIKNKILPGMAAEVGGGTGLGQLERLNDYPNRNINYKSYRENEFFLQEIILKRS